MALKKPKTPKVKPPASTPARPDIKRHRTETVSLDRLQPAAYNPRRITEGAKQGLRSTIERFGLVQQIVWNERTGNIVGGHQRFEVLKDMGETEVAVTVVDLTLAEEKLLNLSLNNPAIQGSWDDSLLSSLSLELGAIGELGDVFGELHLDDLLGFADGSGIDTASRALAGIDEDDDDDLDDDDPDIDAPLGVLNVTLSIEIPQDKELSLREAVSGWATANGVSARLK